MPEDSVEPGQGSRSLESALRHQRSGCSNEEPMKRVQGSRSLTPVHRCQKSGCGNGDPMKHCFGRKSSVPPATNAPAAQSAMPASSPAMKRTGKTLPSSHGRLCKFFGLGPIGGGNRQLIVSATGDCRLQQFACAKQAVKYHQSALVEPMPMQG